LIQPRYLRRWRKPPKADGNDFNGSEANTKRAICELHPQSWTQPTKEVQFTFFRLFVLI
jgi:hypothetical protein